MSKIRLVAYRKETSSSTTETSFELDLQEAPNVSLNFQFSDIKEPETRKGSYSQTFKLPFTENNDSFFQNWYNVNLETLVFSTRTKFDAVLFMGTVPQFEGSLQLKSVYKKAQMYEVVLMSSVATLFSVIGDQRLKDVFLKDNGVYDPQYNHVFNQTQLANSWNGTSSAFVNIDATSLRDTSANVQKVIYPLSITRENFYYNPNDLDASGNAAKRYLRLDSSEISSLGIDAADAYSVPITQFRPSIQIKTLFDTLIAKAGFSYTSNFISGTGDYSTDKYFRKLFMTTCNHLEGSTVPIVNSATSLQGVMVVANNASWHTFSTADSGALETSVIVPANTTTNLGDCTTPTDPDGVWNTQYNYFTRVSSSMKQINIKHIIDGANVTGVSGYAGNNMWLNVQVIPFDTVALQPQYGEDSYDSITTALGVGFPSTSFIEMKNHVLNLENMPINGSACILMRAFNFQASGGTARLDLGNLASYTVGGASLYNVGCGDRYNEISVYYSPNTFGAVIDIPACIDPEIKQKDFLKDIIQRFNLVVATNPEDETNLIIEPYDDFIASGNIKYWTDRLDLSKEVIIKDTTSLQKKIINLSDQPDEDLYNKSIAERYPSVNVFGHMRIDQIGNDFASGEFTNESIFSPFINAQVFASSNEQIGTYLPNMTVQYEFSYEEKDGIYENRIKVTKPKLFFYNGSATNVIDNAGDTVTYYLHNSTSSAVDAYSFTQYPVCSPFDIRPNAANSYTLQYNTKSLYWNATPPLVGNLSVFNYVNDLGNWFNYTLYGLYWKSYLDNIYSSEARIMECYLNLNEVDIFNFSFSDEIFIKDTYWRVLSVSNYQVGGNASTKVTLIKSLDTKENCNGCDYVIGRDDEGSNLYANTFYFWCPEDDPACDIPGPSNASLYATPECCICNGGIVMYQFTAYATSNKYPCLANSGSLPLILKNTFTATSILAAGQTKTLINGILGGRNMPLVRGVDNNKYGQLMMPNYGDDIIIKYKTKPRGTPQLEGESHRVILTGYTSGNTRGYAYPQGDPYSQPLVLPPDINMILRVKGIVTVVGGTSASYPVGTTEGFSYYSAFKSTDGTVVQLGTAGGTPEFALKEGSNPATCTLYIDISQNVLRFGLDDNQTDTKRIWSLTIDYDINRINNLHLPFDENWALYQNGIIIEFQNRDYLIWN